MSTDLKDPSTSKSGLCAPAYFLLTVLGFSFWYFMVVPFGSHRESYSWLAALHSENFAHQLSYGLSSTYRPLSQIVTRLGFQFLGTAFPTSVLRQLLLQGVVYGFFVFAWWLIYLAAPQRRLLALTAFIAGGVFFSGYVHLFHIYGLFYVAVILTLASLIHSHAAGSFAKREVWFAVIATLLAFWHPFATALFVSFYFGFYLETFWQRSRTQHLRAVVILFMCMTAIVVLVAIFPRAQMPVHSRMFGFLVSYQTNEVNRIASFVAFLLAQMVVFSTQLSRKAKLTAALVVSGLSILCLFESLPLILIWICAVLLKLLSLRRWSLFFLALGASLLPFGGGIGTPIYALFAIIVAVYATSLGWSQGERALAFLKPIYVTGIAVALTIIVLMVRAGITVPLVTKVASPLLMERERTYQLEDILAWLHSSPYCRYEIGFAENAGDPVDSVESAITRRNRPPAGIHDVQLFWDTVLRCQNNGRFNDKDATAIVTFGGESVAGSTPVFEVNGRYAGDATVWIANSEPQ